MDIKERQLGITIYSITRGVINQLEGIFSHKELTIISEDMVPPEIANAMGLKSWAAELMGMLVPILETHSGEKYIDIAENNGVPPDACSLPKVTIGMTLKDEMPEAKLIVSSNLPCDSGLSSYKILEKHLNLPTYRVNIPYEFHTERAEKYFVDELKGLISWLEEKTGRKMDWDKLKQICDERNKMARLEQEIWEMLRTRPAPLAAESVYLSHLWHFSINPGWEVATKTYEKLLSLAKKNYNKKIGAVKNEKYRVILWNPPFLHFLDIFNWVERVYGVSLVIDSMTYNSKSIINTESNDSMLKDLGSIIMQGPMARHTRGPAANYLDDIFHLYKHFDIDMVWVASHIGCKNTNALNGMLRELCREKKIPLLIIEYDLTDPRIVPREGIMKQVEEFMDTIMKAERLD